MVRKRRACLANLMSAARGQPDPCKLAG